MDVTDWLAFHAQYRNLTQDAEGTFERDLEATGTTSSGKTMLDYEHTTLTGLFDIRPLQGLAIRAGYRTIDRKLDRNGFDTLRNVDFESKGDDTLVFGFYWRPNAFVRLSGNYEDGDIDRSFTNVSPTERRHLRARATFTPRERMNITLSWLDYEYEKPSSEFAARSEGTTWSVAFQHAPSERIDYMLRYANQDVESFAEVIYDGAGFGGPTALITDATSFYTTDNDYIEARINYRPSPVWRFFLHYGSSDAEGRNESDGTDLNAVPAVPSTLRIVQDYVRSELGGRYTLGSGLFFGAELGIFDYDDRNDLLDYDGTSIVLHAGLEF